jgi:hypothetical protein
VVYGLFGFTGMPAYVAFRRFKRVYFDPYVPLWFVG